MINSTRMRVFMHSEDKDIFMLERAQDMRSILDEAGIENELHVGQGGHNYAYWLSNFETYLKWLSSDW